MRMQQNNSLIFLGVVLLSFVLLAGCPGGGTSAQDSTGISAKSVAGGIEVTWNPSQQTNTVGYNLYRSREAGQLGSKINPIVLTDSSYLDTAISSGAVYYYTVHSIASDGTETTNLEQASATAQLKPPSNLQIDINGDDNYTGSVDVTLSLLATGATECRVSNDQVSWDSWRPYTTSMSWQLTPGDGHKYVYYECKDAVGNAATAVSATIILDTENPELTIYSPVEGGVYNSPFDLNFTVEDKFASRVRCSGSMDNGDVAVGYVDVGVLDSMSINADPGTHTIEISCSDGINSHEQSVSFSVADQPSVEMHIESGAGYVNTRYITLDVTAVNAKECRFANENYGWSIWVPYATNVDWTLSSGDGQKTVYGQCRNAAGETSPIAYDYVTLDTHQGDKISIEIDNGDDWTNTRSVKLGLYCYAADSCRYKNENDDWSGWESYKTSKSWTLSSSKGDKTVYYNCKDNQGYDLGTAEADITYSTKSPEPPSSLSITINGGDSHTQNRDVTLSLSATNADACRYKNPDEAWTQWESYKTTKEWTLTGGDGKKTVYYKCKNDYGSEDTHATIYLDTAGPGKITDLSGFVDANEVVHLVWSRPSGYDIHEYEIYRSTSGMGLMTKIGSTQTTSYEDTTVYAGYTYSYTVRAVDSAGNTGDDSNVATIEVPEEDVGGDTDEHGCIASAGYEWCESLQECIRSWETECPE